MKKTNNKYLYFLFIIFSLLKTNAHSFYLNDSFNVLYFAKYSAFIEFKLKGDSIYFTYKNKREVGYPTEAATKSNFLSVTYSKYYTSNLVAKAEYFTRNKKGKLKKHKVHTFFDNQITSEGIFYEDLIQKTCFFQNLNIGSKSSLEYSYDGTDPVIVPKMMFNFDIPAAEVFYEIKIPNNLNVKFSFFGDSSGIQHKIIHKEKFVIHQYSSFNRKEIVREEESESIYYYVPHLYIIPVSYTVNNKPINLCGSIENLAKYYNKHINVVKDEKNAAIDKLTDSIISGITDSLQQAKAIFNWVQKNIRYIAFEEGLQGFVPRLATHTFENRFGDCKDKANLLIYMYKRAKFNAYYTWVGTREKPYSYTNLPSPLADNHMIVSLHFNNNWYYLDATAPNLEFEYPSAFIQRKEVFIRLEDDNYIIKKIPEVASGKNQKIDSLFIKLNNNELTGQGILNLTGYVKEDYTYKLKNTYDTKMNYKNVIDFGNSDLSLSDINISNNEKLRIKYNFNLPNYIQTFNDETYINFNLFQELNNDIIDIDKRTLGIKNHYKYEINQIIDLTLPENKTVHELPKSSSYKNDSFGYEINYKLNKNHIIFNKKIYVYYLLLEKKSFNDWNEMIENLKQNYSTSIKIITK